MAPLIRHTLEVIRFPHLRVIWAALVLFSGATFAQQNARWTRVIESGASLRPDARVVVLNIRSGKILGSRHLNELARTLAAPGSTLKPILLFQSLQGGIWNADRTVP